MANAKEFHLRKNVPQTRSQMELLVYVTLDSIQLYLDHVDVVLKVKSGQALNAQINLVNTVINLILILKIVIHLVHIVIRINIMMVPIADANRDSSGLILNAKNVLMELSSMA